MQENQLKPISIFASAIFFGAISLFIAIGLHVILPIVKIYGFKIFSIYYGTLFFAALAGIILSIGLYYKDKKNGSVNNQNFFERFWIKKISFKDVLWSISLLVFWIGTLMVVKSFYSKMVSPPEYLENIAGVLYGITLKGSYWIIPVLSVFLVVNIVGEELFWRGYLLPRQEVKYGKHAWIVNGLLWAAFHAPLYWIAPTLALGCVALAFVTQKRRSIWPAIIAHFLLNAADMITGIFTQV